MICGYGSRVKCILVAWQEMVYLQSKEPHNDRQPHSCEGKWWYAVRIQILRIGQFPSWDRMLEKVQAIRQPSLKHFQLPTLVLLPWHGEVSSWSIALQHCHLRSSHSANTAAVPHMAPTSPLCPSASSSSPLGWCQSPIPGHQNQHLQLPRDIHCCSGWVDKSLPDTSGSSPHRCGAPRGTPGSPSSPRPAPHGRQGRPCSWCRHRPRRCQGCRLHSRCHRGCCCRQGRAGSWWHPSCWRRGPRGRGDRSLEMLGKCSEEKLADENSGGFSKLPSHRKNCTKPNLDQCNSGSHLPRKCQHRTLDIDNSTCRSQKHRLQCCLRMVNLAGETAQYVFGSHDHGSLRLPSLYAHCHTAWLNNPRRNQCSPRILGWRHPSFPSAREQMRVPLPRSITYSETPQLRQKRRCNWGSLIGLLQMGMGEKPLETPHNGMVLDAQDPKLKEIDESWWIHQQVVGESNKQGHEPTKPRTKHTIPIIGEYQPGTGYDQKWTAIWIYLNFLERLQVWGCPFPTSGYGSKSSGTTWQDWSCWA